MAFLEQEHQMHDGMHKCVDFTCCAYEQFQCTVCYRVVTGFGLLLQMLCPPLKS